MISLSYPKDKKELDSLFIFQSNYLKNRINFNLEVRSSILENITSKYEIELNKRNNYSINESSVRKIKNLIFKFQKWFFSLEGTKNRGKILCYEYLSSNSNSNSNKTKFKKSNSSLIILRNKSYYDFELKASFFLKDNNSFGILFRYIDTYNYYIFEVSNQDKGFKSI